MLSVVTTCPATGDAYPTGLRTSRRTFNSLPDWPLAAMCPHCDKVHTWRPREAWLEADQRSPVTVVNSAARLPGRGTWFASWF